jgi:hypothetical protein
MSHICGVSKTFGEWYQKTNKTEDTNKLALLEFKIIAILHNTRLATFIDRRTTSDNNVNNSGDRFLKRPLLAVSRSFTNVANLVL